MVTMRMSDGSGDYRPMITDQKRKCDVGVDQDQVPSCAPNVCFPDCRW